MKLDLSQKARTRKTRYETRSRTEIGSRSITETKSTLEIKTGSRSRIEIKTETRSRIKTKSRYRTKH